MKEVWVKDIESKIGEEVQDIFFVTEVDFNRNSNGTSWINCVLADKTGTHKAVIWNECIQDDSMKLKGKVIRAMGQVTVYGSNPRFQIANYQLVEEFEQSDFIYCLDDEIISDQKKRLDNLIASVKDKRLNLLLRCVFKDTFVKKISILPGGKDHHAYNGGLLVHIVEVGEYASFLCENDEKAKLSKRYHVSVNRDLCVTGALLSDIGKVHEYTSYPFSELTEEAYMVGHAMNAIKKINFFIKVIEEKYNQLSYRDVLMSLENIILSAHTKNNKAFPRSKEAIIALNADSNSADLSAYDLSVENYYKSGKTSDEKFINSSHFKFKISKGESECTEIKEQ